MLSTKTLALALGSLAASAGASSLQVNNYCTVTLYVTLVDANYNSRQVTVPSGSAMLQDISGRGNSLGVTKSADYWSSNTPKLIMGTTIDNAQLWWSVSNVDGDPFQGQHFNITSPDHSGKNVCGAASGYGANGNCKDADFTLTLNPCFDE